MATKPAFRDAFVSRRCLIPADGFYEWKPTPKGKQPYAIVPVDEPMFAFAGLWEGWRDRAAGGEWIRTCTIITGPPNEISAPIHNRMPVILDRDAWSQWLGEEPATKDELLSLLKPYPAVRMRAYPIGKRIGNVANDDPTLIEPVVVGT